MSKQLADRNYHFAKPGSANQPSAAPRSSRAQLALQSVQSQKAAVEIDGVVALYSALRPSERRSAERAITQRAYDQRQMANGMTCYVIQNQRPATAPGHPHNPQDLVAALRSRKQAGILAQPTTGLL